MLPILRGRGRLVAAALVATTLFACANAADTPDTDAREAGTTSTSEPDGPVRGSTTTAADGDSAAAATTALVEEENSGLCADEAVHCTSFDAAARWWSAAGGRPYQLPKPLQRQRSLVETPIVLAPTRGGTSAPPTVDGTMLLLFYTSPGESPAEMSTADSLLTSGAYVLQMRLIPSDRKPASDNETAEGFSRTTVKVGDRDRVLEETTDPPTGENSLRVWWLEPAEMDDFTILSEVLVDSVPHDRDDVLGFVEALVD